MLNYTYKGTSFSPITARNCRFIATFASMKYVIIYFILINVVTFAVYGIDKKKARKGLWRIPEATLLLLAVIGGALGAWIGMRFWHHKTLHWKFRIGIPLILLFYLANAILRGGAAFLLQYSLDPAGREEREASSIQFLRDLYPGTAEWMDSMQAAGILRDTFIVNRGHKLHAFYAQHPEAEGTAILVHGYTDNATRMMMLGKMYYDTFRYNILLPEHVRHGQSEGEVIQMGWFDRLDIERWTDIADSVWNGTPIYMHGVSMGAATVMMCSGDALPSSVKGIIEDCGYTSVWDEFAGEIHNQFHLPVHPLMDIASHMCHWRYGWDFKEASALEQVKRSYLPMLFIHGDNDTFVPTAMVHTLYEAKTRGYKHLWLAPGSGHASAFRDHPDEYQQEVERFIHRK